MTKTVEAYLSEGCGRCPLGGTPDCKVHRWTNELNLLRQIVIDSGLIEASKWGVPCYTFQKKNVLVVSAFKDYAFISFFKGSLLSDSKDILFQPGKRSQADRRLIFKKVEEIEALEEEIKTYIFEAIEIEKAGLKVEFKKEPEPIPEELEQQFEKDPMLKVAFESLTPGRQRGYIIYFSAPKKTATRISRIEKCAGKILNGEGLHDKYQSKR